METRASLEVMRGLIHRQFVATVGPEPLELELVEVHDLGVRRTDAGELDNYALVFRSALRDRYAPQGTYRLAQERLGALDVFLVPLGPDGEGMRYEAIFN
jgi:hypothetical protein